MRRKRDGIDKEKKRDNIFTIILSICDVIAVIVLFLLYGPYNNFRDWLVTTAMSTMRHQYIARTFYNDETINKVLERHSMIEPDGNTDTSLILEEDNNYKDKYDKEILDRNKNDIYNYVVNKKRKNIYATLKYASLVLICIGIILFGYRSKAFKNDNNSNVDEIHINEISKITSNDTDVHLIKLESNYIEYDLFSKTFPFYKRSTEAFDKKNNKLKNYTWDISCLGTFDEETKSTSVYNYLYTYKKNDGNGKIIVAFNNTRKPVRDYYFESSTSNYSKIKNKDILIYQYENTYYTEFKDNGIYYDIESHNVSLEDFKYILEIVIE